MHTGIYLIYFKFRFDSYNLSILIPNCNSFVDWRIRKETISCVCNLILCKCSKRRCLKWLLIHLLASIPFSMLKTPCAVLSCYCVYCGCMHKHVLFICWIICFDCIFRDFKKCCMTWNNIPDRCFVGTIWHHRGRGFSLSLLSIIIFFHFFDSLTSVNANSPLTTKPVLCFI